MHSRFAASALLSSILVSVPLLGQADRDPQTDRDSQEASRSVGQRTESSLDARDKIFYPGDTERLKPLGRKLFYNVLLDQKQIWTSPFHMRKQDVKWWVGFGAVTAALIATDHDSSTILENGTSQRRWASRVSNVGASYTLIPLVAGFYGYGVLADDPKPREVGVLGTEALIDSLITVEILKTITMRNRPDSTKDPGKFFAGGTSFPSGHAIESWALASVIAHEYGHGRTKLVPITAYGLAAIVSAARFTAQKHYASDIVVGGAMGWFIGRYVYQTHMDHAIHKHSAWLQPQIVPRVDPSTRTYTVSLLFSGR